ncbi:MAG: SurA N-terminal domain-containing protein [bacterium]
MLQTIHDKSKGWLAYVVVGFITIPFVFWGINEYLGVGDSLLVADVNGTEVTTQQYQRALQQRKQQLREMLGGSVPAEVLDGPEVKQEVLSKLIRDELLRQFADSNNFHVSDAQVAAEIQGLPIFQENGSFSPQRYTKLLEAQRIPKPSFEQNLRQGLRLEQFRKAVASSEFLAPQELRSYLELKMQQRMISFAVVKAEGFLDKVTLTDAEIQSYYDKHKAEYQSEEQVRLDYIVLDPRQVESGVSVTEKEMKDLFEQEKDRFKTPEARKVRQVLIKTGEGAHSEEQAKTLVEQVAKRLAGGDAFESVATEVSEDTLSAPRGGDLGYIYPGDLDPVLEKTIFSASEGEVTAPVKTRLGYVILKVDAVKPAEPKGFDQVKSEIKGEIQKRKADTLISDMSNQLTTLTFDNPGTLDEAADAMGLDVQSSGFIGRNSGGEGIFANPKVMAAAYSEDVLTNGNNSDVLMLDDGREVVIRVAEHKDSKVQGLDEVRQRVESGLRAEKLELLSSEQGNKLLVEAREKGDLKSVADEQGATVIADKLVDRKSTEVPRELLVRTFKVSHPVEGKRVYSGVKMSNGDFGVIELTEVVTPDVSVSDKYAIQSRKALEGGYATRAFDAVYAAMAAEAEIKVFNENL